MALYLHHNYQYSSFILNYCPLYFVACTVKGIIHEYTLLAKKMMMSCTHYIAIAIVHILYCCLLSFYRDASVSPYHVLVDVHEYYSTHCIRL